MEEFMKKSLIFIVTVILLVLGGYFILSMSGLSIIRPTEISIGGQQNTNSTQTATGIPVAEGGSSGSSFSHQPKEEDYIALTQKYDFNSDLYPFFAMLNEDEKMAYYFLYDGICQAKEEVLLGSFIRVPKNDIMNVVTAVYNDHPELFWFEAGITYSYTPTSNYVVGIQPTYNDLADDLSFTKALFESKAEEILSVARRQAGSGVLYQEMTVHDALCNKCEYVTESAHNQSAYSCLVEARSVCSGYARAFQYLMQRLGVPVYYATGSSYSGEPHGWDIIMINGNAYNVDVTWDDEIGVQAGKNVHAFFNVSDGQISRTHTRDELSLRLPACTDESMSYDKVLGDTITIDQIDFNI